MKRIFIAIDISEEARAKVAECIERFRRAFRDLRVGWEKPEKLHLTLKFLGDVDDRRLNDVEHIVQKVATESCPFRSRICGTGRFPPKGDPRILWLGFEDHGTAADMARSIDMQLSKSGFEPEKRKFHPHVTIARLREPHRSRALAAEHVSSEFESGDFDVNEIAIYESQLRPTGSVYRKLASIPFGLL